MTLPYVVSEEVWKAKVLTETVVLKTDFERCQVVVIEITTAAFSGTIDIQGKLHELSAFSNIPYIRQDQATVQTPSVAQISHTTDTGVYRFVVLGYWRRLQLVMTRTAGAITCGVAGSSDAKLFPYLVIAQREPFIFRPGQAALASGMVASGTRSGGATVTSVTANTTVWGTEVVYEPARAGKIDGKATGGVVSGQICIGIKASASTPNAKLTIRVRNKDGGTWVVPLALTGAFALTTAEIYKVYDMPHLLTVANLNAIPFGISIGVESDSSTNDAIARMMETSFIQGEFEPGT